MCPICPRRFQPIRTTDQGQTALEGDGPEPCPLLFIGERPGGEEHKRKRVFVGKTGMELDGTYLPLACLDRDSVRVTNIVKCFAEGNRTPTAVEVDTCAAYWLPGELARCQPEVVILMGASACRISDERIDLTARHGGPFRGSLLGGAWSGWLWPSYHPAMGLHETRRMQELLEDFEALGKWLAEDKPSPKRRTEPNSLYFYLEEDGSPSFSRSAFTGTGAVAVDTERHGSRPYSVQFTRGGAVWMALATNTRALAIAREAIQGHMAILHNAGQDLDLLDRLDIRVNAYRDTMQEAYHQGLAQGLKPLAYRLCGLEMRSWEDVVLPASRDKLTTWLEKALAISETELPDAVRKQLKTKVKVEFKRSPVERGLKRILRHTMESPEYDSWEKLDELRVAVDWEWEYLEIKLGPPPILGIGN